MNKQDKISIIVPCFNEEESIPLFFSAVKKVTDEMDAKFEFWFVDDGSEDNSLSEMKELYKKILKKYIIFHFPGILAKKQLCMLDCKQQLETMLQ